MFIVWNQYSSAKRGYVSKDMFDPYCRRARIAVQRSDGSLFNTTLGQLNFFKWAIQNRIIDFIVIYYDDIVRDMGARLTAKTTRMMAEEEGVDRPTTERRPRKKREELSVSACRGIKTISIKCPGTQEPCQEPRFDESITTLDSFDDRVSPLIVT